MSSSGFLVEVLQWHIEVVDALVDVVCSAVFYTLGFTMVSVTFVITRFTHQSFNLQHATLNSRKRTGFMCFVLLQIKH